MASGGVRLPLLEVRFNPFGDDADQTHRVDAMGVCLNVLDDRLHLAIAVMSALLSSEDIPPPPPPSLVRGDAMRIGDCYKRYATLAAVRCCPIVVIEQRLLSGIDNEGVGGSTDVMLAVVVREMLEMFGVIGCGLTVTL